MWLLTGVFSLFPPFCKLTPQPCTNAKNKTPTNKNIHALKTTTGLEWANARNSHTIPGIWATKHTHTHPLSTPPQLLCCD